MKKLILVTVLISFATPCFAAGNYSYTQTPTQVVSPKKESKPSNFDYDELKKMDCGIEEALRDLGITINPDGTTTYDPNFTDADLVRQKSFYYIPHLNYLD